jgi:hypothetical protein
LNQPANVSFSRRILLYEVSHFAFLGDPYIVQGFLGVVNDLERNGRPLLETLPRYLPGGTEKNRKQLRSG